MISACLAMGDSVIVMKACIEAFADKDVQVVLTTGYRDLPSDTTSFPANFIYETFVPGLLMADRSHVIVHHGGHGASLTGPYTGTPAVIIPTFSERESNARRLGEKMRGYGGIKKAVRIIENFAEKVLS